jgi:hypothetical protein
MCIVVNSDNHYTIRSQSPSDPSNQIQNLASWLQNLYLFLSFRFMSTISLLMPLGLCGAGVKHNFHTEDRMSGANELMLSQHNWEASSQSTEFSRRHSLTVYIHFSSDPSHRGWFLHMSAHQPCEVVWTFLRQYPMLKTSPYSEHRKHGDPGYLSR